MAVSIPADVNPPLLAWAREESGYPIEWIAKRLGVSSERLASWERGERKPTIRQVQDLARRYRRPLGVFFLPQPPAVAPLASEYRRLPGVRPGTESPEFRLALRTMSSRREAALELNDELAAAWPAFSTSARLAEGPVPVGRRLRASLGLTLADQFGWRDEWQAWRSWRSLAEAAGILVFLFPKVALEEARGLSLLEFPLPVVGVNSREHAPGAKVFSLLHEVVHVALALGQDERVALRETRGDAEWAVVERFAEEAASEAIIPGDALEEVLSVDAPRAGNWDVARVRRLAAKFRVTPLAMATRLRAAGILDWNGYERWKGAWSDYLSQLPAKRSGIASPVERMLGQAGRPFARLVLEALDTNRVTAVDACRQLGLRFDHLEDLRAELRGGWGASGKGGGGE